MAKPYIYTPQTYRLPFGNATIPIKKQWFSEVKT